MRRRDSQLVPKITIAPMGIIRSPAIIIGVIVKTHPATSRPMPVEKTTAAAARKIAYRDNISNNNELLFFIL